jgi:hypothetical protein
MTGNLDLSSTGTLVDADPETRERFTGVFEHDVVLSNAGLHWLSVKAVGHGPFSVSRTKPIGPVVASVLEAAVALGGRS